MSPLEPGTGKGGYPLGERGIGRVPRGSRIAVGQLSSLFHHGLEHALVALSKRCEERARTDVEQTPAVVVDEVDALACDDRRQGACRRTVEEHVLGPAHLRIAAVVHPMTLGTPASTPRCVDHRNLAFRGHSCTRPWDDGSAEFVSVDRLFAKHRGRYCHSVKRARLENVAPVLLSADVAKTTEYYRSVLGFEVVEHYGAGEPFATLYRDGVEIIVVQARFGEVEPNALRFGAGYDLYLDPEDVEGVDLLHTEFASRGVARPARAKDDSLRVLRVRHRGRRRAPHRGRSRQGRSRLLQEGALLGTPGPCTSEHAAASSSSSAMSGNDVPRPAVREPAPSRLHGRMATVRSRVLATLALSFAFAACSGSPVFAADQHGRPACDPNVVGGGPVDRIDGMGAGRLRRCPGFRACFIHRRLSGTDPVLRFCALSRDPVS